jgi:dolichol-phosphate mannosyltransferase
MSDPSTSPTLSLVIPAWNEEKALPPTIDRILRVIKSDNRLVHRTEIIIVDDGSTDDTAGAARKALDGYVPGTVVELAGNVGSHAAIRCGLRHASGERVVILSADGQDPPETILAMLDRLDDGAEIVWGQRTSRSGDPTTRRALAGVFYRMYRIATGLQYPPSGLDFVMLSRPVVDALERFSERNLPLFLLIYNLGYRQSLVPYERGERSHGESGWSLGKRVEMGFDMLTAFSATPLRLVSAAGLVIGLLGLMFGAFTLIRGLVSDVPVEGWASLMVMTSVMGGMILLAISVLGEYVWRTLDEVRGRPVYLEREVTIVEFDGPAASDRSEGVDSSRAMGRFRRRRAT